MPINAEQLRNAMRFWATGVTIVSANHQGEQHGMTVSSFTSITLTPPLVVVSLERETRTHNLVDASGAFGVTILRAEQQALSDRFAGRETEQDNRFNGLETRTLATGSPFLKDGLACFDCRVTAQHQIGSHTLFIGEVVAAEVNPQANNSRPLLYYNRDYRQLLKE